MWSEALNLFREYMGTGLLTVWFVLSLAYLWVREKDESVRILFVYMPVVVLLLYFNPLFAELVFRMAEEEIYYRILWLLPVTLVNAYTVLHIFGQAWGRQTAGGKKARLKKGFACGGAVLGMGAVLAVSGSYVYSNPNFVKAQNFYHVPDSVVHICDAILVPGREVMAVFPLELVQYVRQYTPLVCMPYGREMMVERWNYDSDLCTAMEAEEVDMEELAALVRQEDCHFCILRADKVILGDPKDYGWILVDEIDGYVIYRDPARELTVPGRK